MLGAPRGDRVDLFGESCQERKILIGGAAVGWQDAVVPMIHYRDSEWLVVGGASRFSAFITPAMQTSQQVDWSLELSYHAGGAKWRRVVSWMRPLLWIRLAGFHPPAFPWTTLEKLDFWGGEEVITAENEHAGGYVEAGHFPHGGSQEREEIVINEFVWRVARRERGWFRVEFAGFTQEEVAAAKIEEQAMLAEAAGHEWDSDRERDFWKQHAEIYLAEDVPFGTVTVQVPRNARDVREFALARAKSLIGVDEPEDIEVDDFLHSDNFVAEIKKDLFVRLHFNGYFED